MIKLLTLKAISPYAEDTVYKICLSLEEKGLHEENTEKFDSYDDMIEYKKKLHAEAVAKEDY